MRNSTLVLLLLAFAPALMGSNCDPEPTGLRVIGRLAFREDSGCVNAVSSASNNWAECHAFKRHFYRTLGTPIVEDYGIPGALRPLRATVELKYVRNNLSGTRTECARHTIQTDLNGFFNVPVEPCGGTEARAVIGRVWLQYRIQNDARTNFGFVRGVWRVDQAEDLFALTGDDEIQNVPHFTTMRDGAEVTFAIPMLAFKVELTGAEPTGTVEAPGTINLGTQIFLTDDSHDQYGYMRQVLKAYSTMVELHEKLRSQMAAAGREDEYFSKMFVNVPEAHWIVSYGIWFDNTWAYGWTGGIALYRPDLEKFTEDGNRDGRPDGSWGLARLISGEDVLTHEFGHSVQGGYAPLSRSSDYRFANPMRDSGDEDYDWGHSPGQYQDMGTAYSEGSASALGQYFLNGCNRWAGLVARPDGGARPFSQNMWSGDTSCDGTENNACAVHHFRWHMEQRGVTSDSNTNYTTRLSRLQALTSGLVTNGHDKVTSNDEGRYAEFMCDLVDTTTSTTHALSSASHRYGVNFTHNVHKIMNGENPTQAYSTYPSTVPTENVALSLPQLLDVMSGFCVDCNTTLLPNDLISTAYGNERLAAIGGRVSPQAMSSFIVGRGLATRQQMRDVLQTNFMEHDF